MEKNTWTPELEAELMEYKRREMPWKEIGDIFGITSNRARMHYCAIVKRQTAEQPDSNSIAGQITALTEKTLAAYSKLLGNRTIHIVLNDENSTISTEATTIDVSNRCVEISVTRHGEVK